jgi:hypothetical protein
VFALFLDPGRTGTPGHFGVPARPLRSLTRWARCEKLDFGARSHGLHTGCLFYTSQGLFLKGMRWLFVRKPSGDIRWLPGYRPNAFLSTLPLSPAPVLSLLPLGFLLDLGSGLGPHRSGSSNLLPRTYRVRHDRRIGCMGDFTGRVCPGPSTLRWTLRNGRDDSLQKVARQTVVPQRW